MRYIFCLLLLSGCTGVNTSSIQAQPDMTVSTNPTPDMSTASAVDMDTTDTDAGGNSIDMAQQIAEDMAQAVVPDMVVAQDMTPASDMAQPVYTHEDTFCGQYVYSNYNFRFPVPYSDYSPTVDPTSEAQAKEACDSCYTMAEALGYEGLPNNNPVHCSKAVMDISGASASTYFFSYPYSGGTMTLYFVYTGANAGQGWYTVFILPHGCLPGQPCNNPPPPTNSGYLWTQ